MYLGARVREIRKAKGITGNYITKALGKNSSWLSARERGKTEITAIELKEIAKLLNVDMEVFFVKNSHDK